MARLTLPSRLELKRPEGSSREAPLAKVIFTTLLYVSPVQIIPECSHTGTPLHFHSSTTSGSASLMRRRILASISPRQSPSSSILASISRGGECSASRLFELVIIVVLRTLIADLDLQIRKVRRDAGGVYASDPLHLDKKAPKRISLARLYCISSPSFSHRTHGKLLLRKSVAGETFAKLHLGDLACRGVRDLVHEYDIVGHPPFGAF